AACFSGARQGVPTRRTNCFSTASSWGPRRRRRAAASARSFFSDETAAGTPASPSAASTPSRYSLRSANVRAPPSAPHAPRAARAGGAHGRGGPDAGGGRGGLALLPLVQQAMDRPPHPGLGGPAAAHARRLALGPRTSELLVIRVSRFGLPAVRELELEAHEH